MFPAMNIIFSPFSILLFSINLLHYLGVQIQIQIQLQPGRTAGSYLPFWSWPEKRGIKDIANIFLYRLFTTKILMNKITAYKN